MNIKELALKLKSFTNDDNIKLNEPMKNHTTFKVGGPVDIMVEPENESEVCEIIKYLNKNNIPFIVLGNGSNLIVRDGGIEGVAIKLADKFKKITIEGEVITAECGVLMSELAQFAMKNELTGLEFSSGIPGTIGGGTTMNAGAYDGEISNNFLSCMAIDNEGNIHKLGKEEMNFEYRKTIIQTEGYIVYKVEFKLQKGNKESIKDKMIELNKKRREKQPLEFPSAGSTFKRPTGYFAGKLIQDAGLRGFRIGDAAVSEKHTGFIVNLGNATAKDILSVIGHVQETVKNKFGVCLETEVKIIGKE